MVAEVAERPAGGGWQAPAEISTPGLEAHVPQVAVDPAGDAVAAWYRFDGSTGTVEGTTLSAGGSWSTPVRISPLGANAEPPQVAMSTAGAAQVVWSGWNEATHNYQLRASRVPLNGGWKGSVLVSPELEEAYGPHVAVDQSGNAIVVWNGEVALAAEIRSSFRAESSALVVSKTGSGTGTVTSQPAAIDCGGVCAANLPEETSVTLTATAGAGSRFAGWSGPCAGTGPCTAEIGEAQTSVGADFESIPAGGGGDPESIPDPDGGAGGASTSKATSDPAATAAPSCTAVAGVPSVGTFAPSPKPGLVVAGIRARVGVSGPSSVSVTGTLSTAPASRGGSTSGRSATTAAAGEICASPSPPRCDRNCRSAPRSGCRSRSRRSRTPREAARRPGSSPTS